MRLMIHANTHTLWQHTIQEAEDRCAVILERYLETYLISLLSRYTDQPAITRRLFASALLSAMEKSKAERDVALQRVGDECLLFSGLFPEVAKRKNVGLGYFVDIGRSAYGGMSDSASDIFNQLAVQFVVLMDVLQSVRADTTLLPLDAYDQWEALGSQRALRILRSYLKT